MGIHTMISERNSVAKRGSIGVGATGGGVVGKDVGIAVVGMGVGMRVGDGVGGAIIDVGAAVGWKVVVPADVGASVRVPG